MIRKSKIEQQKSPGALLAFAAHPDDIEFGCGAIIAKETAAGRKCHFVICSHGESASNGTPAQRTHEAKTSAQLLGASVEFLNLGKNAGDGRLEALPAHARKLAAIIRRHKPALVLAPTLVKNQHPDHAALGALAQTAARLARYAGIRELKKLPPHAIGSLLYYAITPDAEPKEISPILIDISAPSILESWIESMHAHASQMKTRNYVELQTTRARLNGLRAGVAFAIPLFPNDPILLNDLSTLTRSARSF